MGYCFLFTVDCFLFVGYWVLLNHELKPRNVRQSRPPTGHRHEVFNYGKVITIETIKNVIKMNTYGMRYR